MTDKTSRRPKALSPAAMQKRCDAFNARFKVGACIFVWPGARAGDPVPRVIAEPGAYVLSGHTPVVQIAGGGGCIALTHVDGFV